MQFSPYSVGVYYFCTVEWYCLCKYPDIKLYGHHEMVAEDSILPASKTLALAQWKILLVFFSHQVDSSVQPKPGFGNGNRNQDPILVSVSEPKLLFPKLKLFYSKRFKYLSCFPTSWGDIDFYKLEKNLQIFSNRQWIWF